MKKITVLILSITVCLLFMACVGPDATGNQGEEKTDREIYEEYIKAIEEAMANDFQNTSFEEMQVTSLFMWHKTSEFGYCYLDLDKDGKEELIIGDPNEYRGDTTIYGIYTVRDGQVRRTVDGWDRNRYYLCEDGLIANEGSSGAANSTWALYEYKYGGLSLIEAVILDGITDEQNPWFYSTTGTHADEAESITKEEAQNIMNSCVYTKLDLTLFDGGNNGI